ncbi:MAG: hypothetical protein OEY67_02860 [Gammaproteobacteria bacterium]|nr:hypothetical protein [Gammaproteobacteria bacterium]
MPAIEIIRVSLTLTVQVAMEQLRQEMGELVTAVGPNLALQVDAFTREEKLGYYPALDYFNNRPGIDPNLLSTSEHIASLVCDYVRYQMRIQLREPFSHIKFDKIQSLAFSMPRVLPSDRNALEKLTEHYSPNRVRAIINASSIEKASTNTEGYERLVVHKAQRWLEKRFEAVHISDARKL